MECNRDCIICGSDGALSKLEWFWGFWDNDVDVSHNHPFKELNGYRRECYGSVVIQAGYFSVIGHMDYGGMLETCLYYRLRLGEVENVSEDNCQLVSACSEYMS
jgi:hypothetical protein